MAMRFKSAGGEPVSDINITPLIDVMLVLLTMLIITIPIQTHVVTLAGMGDIPPPAEQPRIVALNVDFDGTLSWDGQVVDRAGMDARLAQAAHQAKQPEIHLYANRLARYDGVAKILADAQRLGITGISFVNVEEDADARKEMSL